MIEKNKNYVIKIEDSGQRGEGIGRIKGFVCYIPGTLPGDSVLFKAIKVNSSYAIGKLVQINEASEYRISPPCPVATTCGGCQIQEMNYNQQLILKETKLNNQIKRIGNISSPSILKIKGMKNPFFYRNKAQFAINRNASGIEIGLYKIRSHTVVDIDSCEISHPLINKVLKKFKEFTIKYPNLNIYNELTHEGILRHLMIRTSFSNNTAMVCLVINGTSFEFQNDFLDALKQIPEIKSIFINHNSHKGDTILGETFTHLFGEDYIIEKILGLNFKISPASFFQINPEQTKVLFNEILNSINFNKTDIVWDLYCGTGSIALLLARHVKHVLGVEMVASAISDAKENAKINAVNNVEFIEGAAEKILIQSKQKETPTVIVVDPPRKGCHIELINYLLKVKARNIIYVSCDPSTLARDLKLLSVSYKIETIQPVDMFPHTVHVESVTTLSLIP